MPRWSNANFRPDVRCCQARHSEHWIFKIQTLVQNEKNFINSCVTFWIMAHSELVKGIAIGMMMCGRSANQVEKELGINRSVILRWWRRWQEEGNLKRRRGSGRPRVTKKRSDRTLVVQAKRHRFQSVPRLFVSWASAAGVTCSVRTAYRRLAEAGLKSYRPAVRIPLSE